MIQTLGMKVGNGSGQAFPLLLLIILSRTFALEEPPDVTNDMQERVCATSIQKVLIHARGVEAA